MNYPCPNCKTVLDIDEKYAGMKLECPSCKQEFQFTLAPASVQPAPVTVQQPQTENMNLMFCPDCGNQYSRSAQACPKCGAPNPNAAAQVQTSININMGPGGHQQGGYTVQQKSRLVYILLALFLGLLGIHNFYAGYTGTGLIQLVLSLTGFGAIAVVIWVILDILLTTKDGRGVPFA